MDFRWLILLVLFEMGGNPNANEENEDERLDQKDEHRAGIGDNIPPAAIENLMDCTMASGQIPSGGLRQRTRNSTSAQVSHDDVSASVPTEDATRQAQLVEEEKYEMDKSYKIWLATLAALITVPAQPRNQAGPQPDHARFHANRGNVFLWLSIISFLVVFSANSLLILWSTFELGIEHSVKWAKVTGRVSICVLMLAVIFYLLSFL